MSIRAPFAALVAVTLASFAGCAAPSEPSGDGALRPTVNPITAVFNAGAQSTTYRARIHNNEAVDLVVTAAWTGANCGTASLADQLIVISRATSNVQETDYTWTHPHPPCGGSDAHDEATVQLTVRWTGGTATCSYRGAAGGTGPACEYR
jgi:hypothetical protein